MPGLLLTVTANLGGMDYSDRRSQIHSEGRATKLMEAITEHGRK